jgi:hypothetical protein
VDEVRVGALEIMQDDGVSIATGCMWGLNLLKTLCNQDIKNFAGNKLEIR